MASKERGTGSFTAEEKAAMKERAAEAKRAKAKDAAAADAAVCAEKIAEMPPADRKLAQQVHDIVTSVAPELAPKTFYGMPAYAKDGKIVVFFQSKSEAKRS